MLCEFVVATKVFIGNLRAKGGGSSYSSPVVNYQEISHNINWGAQDVCMCVCVYTYVCVHVCVCMHVCQYVRIHICMVCVYECMHACAYAYLPVSMSHLGG